MALHAGGALCVYNGMGWGRLNEVIRIPVIEYLSVLLLALLVGGGLWVTRRLGAGKVQEATRTPD